MEKEERTKCEVVIAPDTIFGVGVTFKTLLDTLRERGHTISPHYLTKEVRTGIKAKPQRHGWFVIEADGNVHYYAPEEIELAHVAGAFPGNEIRPALIGDPL